ncbi:hypothetical protein BDF21DRAFT_462411 [Thamnidium elegans]|nr:hypothetical protein BDF21DRAFT_462411 [Thamnidium elegans]
MADQKALQAIERIEEETKCSICTCTYSDAHLLNCGHTYCGSCILMWLQQKKSCPKCRVPAIRQPVPVLALQNICDLLCHENANKEKKMCRADWEELYPIENQAGYIRDEDQDGIIHRCSNCGWELDEDNYCGNCMIHYDNGSIVNDNESDYNMQSDAGSHMEPEEDEDLDDFVVEDGQVDYEDVIHDSILDEDDEMEPVVRKHRKRRRVIDVSEDEDDNVYERPIVIADDDDDDDDDNNEEDDMSNGEVEMTYSYGDNDQEEVENFSDNEFPEDVFSRPKRSIYIDDVASEDEEEEIRPKKVDKVLDTIAKAQDRMKRATATPVNKESSSSSSSSDDSEDEPDYNLVS